MKEKRFFIACIIFVIIFKVDKINALGLDLMSSPTIISTGEIYLLSDSPETAFYQPAKSIEGISLSHSNPHGFWELNVFQLASQFRVFNEVFSAGAFVLENNHISEKTLYLGYAKSINNISLGANIKYYNQGINNYDTLDAFTLNVGAIWEIGAFCHGMSYSNISHTSRAGIDLPTIFKYECMIMPFEKTRFALSLEKERGFEMKYCFAVSHELTNNLKINTGFGSHPAQFSAGMYLELNPIDVSVGIRTHGELGFTQAVGIIYGF